MKSGWRALTARLEPWHQILKFGYGKIKDWLFVKHESISLSICSLWWRGIINVGVNFGSAEALLNTTFKKRLGSGNNVFFFKVWISPSFTKRSFSR